MYICRQRESSIIALLVVSCVPVCSLDSRISCLVLPHGTSKVCFWQGGVKSAAVPELPSHQFSFSSAESECSRRRWKFLFAIFS